MSRFDFSGYPTRDVIPRGYTFYQFVSNFRAAGGYGSLVPRQASAIAPPSAPGSRASETAGGPPGLAISQASEKASDTIEQVMDRKQESGEFDAVEGEAQAESRREWRDPKAR